MNGINSLFLKSTKLSDLLSSEEVTKARVNMSLNEMLETMQKKSCWWLVDRDEQA
jgi:hypothetical protein